MIEEQMSIFDFLPSSTPDINDITEAEAVKLVGEQLGVKFIYNAFFEQWEAKKGRAKMGLTYDHFNGVHNNALFLGTHIDIGTAGAGAPCSGIDDAVKWFKTHLEKWR